MSKCHVFPHIQERGCVINQWHFPRVLVRKKGSSGGRVGALPIQNSLVSEAGLTLPCSLTFAVKALILLILDKEANVPRWNIFESFLCTFPKK